MPIFKAVASKEETAMKKTRVCELSASTILMAEVDFRAWWYTLTYRMSWEAAYALAHAALAAERLTSRRPQL